MSGLRQLILVSTKKKIEANLLRSDIELLLCVTRWYCGQRVVYGDWQVFLPMEICTSPGNLYLTHDIPEANCWPQGLKPPAKPPAKPAPKAAKPRAKPSTKSAAKPAAQVAAKPAAQPAAGEPIPVAPVVHVQLFRESLFLRRAEHASQQAIFRRILLFIRLCVFMSCFVSRVLIIVIGGAREPPFGVFWGMFRGCEGMQLLFPGGGGGAWCETMI